jgi:hypothetical protein
MRFLNLGRMGLVAGAIVLGSAALPALGASHAFADDSGTPPACAPAENDQAGVDVPAQCGGTTEVVPVDINQINSQGVNLPTQ